MPTLQQRAKPRRWAVPRSLVVPEWRWAWRGLSVAYPFWEGGGLPFDYASRSMGITLGGADWVSSEEGSGLYLNGAGDYPEFPATAGNKAPYDEITLYTRWKFNGVSPDWHALVAKMTAGGPSWISYDFQQDGANLGKVEFQMSTTAVANTGTVAIAPIPQDRFINLFGRWRTGDKMVLTALEDDGSLFEEKDRAALGGTILMTDNNLVLGEFGGLCSNVCVWNRRLNYNEIVAIAKDPFGPFRLWRPKSAFVPAAPPPPAVGDAFGETGEAVGITHIQRAKILLS